MSCNFVGGGGAPLHPPTTKLEDIKQFKKK